MHKIDKYINYLVVTLWYYNNAIIKSLDIVLNNLTV